MKSGDKRYVEVGMLPVFLVALIADATVPVLAKAARKWRAGDDFAKNDMQYGGLFNEAEWTALGSTEQGKRIRERASAKFEEAFPEPAAAGPCAAVELPPPQSPVQRPAVKKEEEWFEDWFV